MWRWSPTGMKSCAYPSNRVIMMRGCNSIDLKVVDGMEHGNADWLRGPDTIEDAVSILLDRLVHIERQMLERVHDVAGLYQARDASVVRDDIIQDMPKCMENIEAYTDVIGFLTGHGFDAVPAAVENIYGNGSEAVIVNRFAALVEGGFDQVEFFDGCAGDDELAEALDLKYRDAESLRAYLKHRDEVIREQGWHEFQPTLWVDWNKLYVKE